MVTLSNLPPRLDNFRSVFAPENSKQALVGQLRPAEPFSCRSHPLSGSHVQRKLITSSSVPPSSAIRVACPLRRPCASNAEAHRLALILEPIVERLGLVRPSLAVGEKQHPAGRHMPQLVGQFRQDRVVAASLGLVPPVSDPVALDVLPAKAEHILARGTVFIMSRSASLGLLPGLWNARNCAVSASVQVWYPSWFSLRRPAYLAGPCFRSVHKPGKASEGIAGLSLLRSNSSGSGPTPAAGAAPIG